MENNQQNNDNSPKDNDDRKLSIKKDKFKFKLDLNKLKVNKFIISAERKTEIKTKKGLFNLTSIVRQLFNISENFKIEEELINTLLLQLLDIFAKYGVSEYTDIDISLSHIEGKETITVIKNYKDIKEIINKNVDRYIEGEIPLRHFSKYLSRRFKQNIIEELNKSKEERTLFKEFNLGFLDHHKKGDYYTDAFANDIAEDKRIYEKIIYYVKALALHKQVKKNKETKELVRTLILKTSEDYLLLRNSLRTNRVLDFLKKETKIIEAYYINQDLDEYRKNIDNLYNDYQIKIKNINFKVDYKNKIYTYNNISEKSSEEEEESDESSDIRGNNLLRGRGRNKKIINTRLSKTPNKNEVLNNYQSKKISLNNKIDINNLNMNKIKKNLLNNKKTDISSKPDKSKKSVISKKTE